jgi:hypothetical protein
MFCNWFTFFGVQSYISLPAFGTIFRITASQAALETIFIAIDSFLKPGASFMEEGFKKDLQNLGKLSI